MTATDAHSFFLTQRPQTFWNKHSWKSGTMLPGSNICIKEVTSTKIPLMTLSLLISETKTVLHGWVVQWIGPAHREERTSRQGPSPSSSSAEDRGLSRTTWKPPCSPQKTTSLLLGIPRLFFDSSLGSFVTLRIYEPQSLHLLNGNDASTNSLGWWKMLRKYHATQEHGTWDLLSSE